MYKCLSAILSYVSRTPVPASVITRLSGVPEPQVLDIRSKWDPR